MRLDVQGCVIGVLLGLVLTGFLGAPAAQAVHEQLGIYDDWSTSTIRADRWLGRADDGHELRREIPVFGHRLVMRYRRVGRLVAGSGLVGVSHRMFLSNAALIDHLETDFRVHRVEVAGCPENPGRSRVRPAIIDFNAFNDGTAGGPGDLTGDHFVRVLVNQEEDAANLAELTVQAYLFRCTDPACASATATVFNLNLGAVRVGKQFTLSAIWDRPGAQFLVGFNASPDVALAYNPALDVTDARVPFASVRQQLVVADCAKARAVVDAETAVREVRTNAGAIIP